MNSPVSKSDCPMYRIVRCWTRKRNPWPSYQLATGFFRFRCQTVGNENSFVEAVKRLEFLGKKYAGSIYPFRHLLMRDNIFIMDV